MYEAPSRPVHSPSQHAPPMCGRKVQCVEPEKKLPMLSPPELKRTQQAVGIFLHYARAQDMTMAVATHDLAAAQSKGNEETMKALVHLLNYAATHPDAKIRCHRSGMILHVHSDGSYLSIDKARSRAGGHYFLSSPINDPSKAKPNGAIHVLCNILKQVLSSAAETEIASAFYNSREALPLRQVLKFLNHPQPPTPMQVDNTTAINFINKELKQKRSKAIDMHFY